VKQVRYPKWGEMEGRLPVIGLRIFGRLQYQWLPLKATNGLNNQFQQAQIISNAISHLARHSLPTRETAHEEPFCNREVSKRSR
jgi:hypothetical protein